MGNLFQSVHALLLGGKLIIPSEMIIEAKKEFGERAAEIIALDLKIEKFDEKNLKGCCPFHDEDTPSFVWNSKDNAFKCFGCGKRYGILDHYTQFNKLSFLESLEKLFGITGINYKFGERGVRVNKEYIYPHEDQSETRSNVDKYMSKRDISTETLDYFDVRESTDNANIVFKFFDDNDILCVVKYRPARKVSNNEDFKYWTQKDAGTMPLLFGMNKVNTTFPLVITEGECDALSVFESGYANVVSIPFGSGKNKISWLEHNFDWLEQFNEIILWFDNDKSGIESRKDASARLGSWRTKYVELPIEVNGKKVKDANDVLFHLGKTAVLNFIENAQEIPVQNVVDLSTVEDFDIEKAGGLFSGIKSLDDIIYKFVYGSVVILTGKKGHGKSTLLNQVFISEALNQGEDVFIFSGELRNSILKNWIETTMIGRENIKMKNNFVRNFEKDAREEMRKWYAGRIWSFDGSTNDADTIIDRAINVTRKFGAKIWVLDNLMTLDIGVTGQTNELQMQGELMVKLTNLAALYNVLVVLVAHPRKSANGFEISRRLQTDDVAGAGAIGNLAQYIISVHRFSKEEKEGELNKSGTGYVKGKKPIEYDVVTDVLKNRYTGKDGAVPLYFDYPSYRFYQTALELWKRYGWNKSTAPMETKDPNTHGLETPDWAVEQERA